MNEQSDRQVELQSPEGDLDRALDAALAKYTAVEPRDGLEGRVMANVRESLRAEQARDAQHAWWRWGLVAVSTAIVILTVGVAIRSGRHDQTMTNPVTATSRSTQIPDGGKPEAKLVAHERGTAQEPQRVQHKNLPPSAQRKAVAKADPKLDEFPSHRPLTDEEIALVQYVKQFPKDALLIAQAQEEFDAEIQADLQQTTPESEPAGSNQKER